jgi:hypothetical protein
MKLAILTTAFIFSAVIIIPGCIDKTPTNRKPLDTEALTANQKEVHGTLVQEGDLEITRPLNAQWVTEGKSIAEVKCQSCHRLTAEKLVGPGWLGVSSRRKPEWIVNMITNVEVMLEKDPAAQKLLEECLVRMPNQNLSKDEARKVLEFMRSNDGEK